MNRLLNVKLGGQSRALSRPPLLCALERDSLSQSAEAAPVNFARDGRLIFSTRFHWYVYNEKLTLAFVASLQSYIH